MTHRKAVCRGAVSLAALMMAAAFAGGSNAQDTGSAPPSADKIEKVTVTGSHIKRRRESTSLPVDVVTSEDLEKDGAPTIVEVAKALPVSNGVLGDTNQFNAAAQGSEGTGSINLRGLGPQRTLILLNGRRLAYNPFGLGGQGVVDTNTIPIAAIDRIEVLKDGAAVTYGSDAIGGVVNFITRKNYDGLGLAGDWRFVNGADGDYSAQGIYGYDTETMNAFLSIGYQHRSDLDTLERDFTQSSFARSPEAGYTGAGSPGTFIGSNGAVFLDPQCAVLGGTPNGAACRQQYIDFDNLQEEEDKLQLFGSVNIDLSSSARVFMDALYATTNVPRWETTPSYALLARPSLEAQPGLVGPLAFLNNNFYVPPTNPGLINMMAQNPSLVPALTNGAGVLSPLARPVLLGGNPLFGNFSSVGERDYEAYRLSGGIEGDLGDSGLSYELALTYSSQNSYRDGYDTITNRFALALRGFGGPDCDKEPLTPGIQGPGGGAAVAGANGCKYWNPFSNAIPRNVVTGEVNPQFNAAVANDPEVFRWFFQKGSTDRTDSLFVADALITGSTGVSLWAEDPIEFAFGGQYRKDFYEATESDITNALKNPCVSSPDFFNNTCTGAQRNGPFVFLGVATPQDLEGDAYALFTEFNIPVLENLELQVAARFEDYGGDIGSTFDPKISGRWQIADFLALRGSAGSTFRGPPLVQLAPNNVTSLQFIGGTFRAVDIGGNPGLQPESADTFSVGAIFNFKWLTGSVDYWAFDFENPIIAEPLGGMVATMFPGGASTNCGNAAFAALEARFTFVGACSVANIARVQTFYVNGSPVVTKGFDFMADAKFGELLDGDIGAGGSLTYVKEYHTDPIAVAGRTVQGSFEAAGFLNYQTTAYPIPQWKGTAYLEYESAMHGLRLNMNYMDSYVDQRFAAGALGQTIDEWITFDLTYRLIFADDLTFSLAVDNMFDEDPPFARLDLGYDPFTATPLGRTVKIGVRKKF